jgi:alkylhydroperoxidase family enzyme
MTAPRIEPAVPPYSEAVRTILERLMPPGVPPLVLFTTLAHSERAFSRFMAAGLLDKGPLPLREREIMIDRTCARAGSEYEWGVHIALFAERADLTKEQVAATVRSGVSDIWPARERLVVRLADELHDTSAISDGLWSELQAAFSVEQIFELILLAGFYHTVAYLTNGLKLPLEAYAARFSNYAEVG